VVRLAVEIESKEHLHAWAYPFTKALIEKDPEGLLPSRSGME
jgi:hypothetical protein